MEIAVERLREELLPDVIRIHQGRLGYSLNSRLGKQHLAFLYRAMTEDPQSYVGVAIFDGRPVGIVSGTADERRLKTKILRSMPVRHLALTALRLLTTPRLIYQWWQGQAIAAPLYFEDQEVTAVLTAIAVDPAFEGRGIGRRLVSALESYFTVQKLQSYRLDTLLENQRARNFYDKLGFVEAETRAGSVILLRVLGA